MVTVATWQEQGNSHNGENRGLKDTKGINLTQAEAWSIMAETSTGNKIYWTEVAPTSSIIWQKENGKVDELAPP